MAVRTFHAARGWNSKLGCEATSSRQPLSNGRSAWPWRVLLREGLVRGGYIVNSGWGRSTDEETVLRLVEPIKHNVAA